MERHRHLNEELGGHNTMSVSFDIGTGYVHAHCPGFWSVKQARAYFNNWEDVIGRIHHAGLPVTAFVDLSESGVQKAEVAGIISSVTMEMYRTGDSIAMLVPTSLAKMQMRRVLDPRYHEFFVSRHAAQTWLRARSPAVPLAQLA